LRGLAPIIRHHHERLDGHGYPDGLQGQEIPLEARIICLADSLEAMASDRPYRKALSFEEILYEIDSNTGTQFDPLVVNAFRKILAREGQIALVNSALLLENRDNAEIHTNSNLS
jgi:HD-GYP domain-containing protein (c-di-GMP phosphodiesterase class II)